MADPAHHLSSINKDATKISRLSTAFNLPYILAYIPKKQIKQMHMQVVKLRKVGNSTIVTLPASVVEALHLKENDEIAVEVAGDRIMLTPASSDFQHAWAAYQAVEPRYRNANRKLAE